MQKNPFNGLFQRTYMKYRALSLLTLVQSENQNYSFLTVREPLTSDTLRRVLENMAYHRTVHTIPAMHNHTTTSDFAIERPGKLLTRHYIRNHLDEPMSNIWSAKREKGKLQGEGGKKNIDEEQQERNENENAGEREQDEAQQPPPAPTTTSWTPNKKNGKVFRLLRRSDSEASSASSSTASTLSNKSKRQQQSGVVGSTVRRAEQRSSENNNWRQSSASHSKQPKGSHSPSSITSSPREKITKIIMKPFLLQRRSKNKTAKSIDVAISLEDSDSNTNPNQNATSNGNQMMHDDEGNRDDDTKRLEIISEKFPSTTEMERERFLAHRTLERAIEKLEYFTAWREEYRLDSPEFQHCRPVFESDAGVWEWTVGYAAKHYKVKGKEGYQIAKIQSKTKSLPRIVRFGDKTDLTAIDGRRMVHVLPGMIDKSIAPLDFYALCVAFYLDVKLSRESNEDIHVLVDVRAGRNWPNAPPTVLIPFVKQLTKQLADNFPERMFHSVVYPIPSPAKVIWAMFKTFLHPKILTKIDILWGPAGVDSPTPRDMLDGSRTTSLDEATLSTIEEYRRLEFL